MPRTLPWLLEASRKKAGRSPSTSPSATRKRASSPGDLVDSDLNIINDVPLPERGVKKPRARSPSTSPPPAPPDVEYMNEGYGADDGWMMVEDEFYTTSKMFTQHIHHAEYVRLKRLARARGERTLSGLERGTDGVTPMSVQLKTKREAREIARKQKAELKDLASDGSESEEVDEFMLDPQLAGLMAKGSQTTVKDLTKFAKHQPNTRAAAGCSHSPHKVERTRDVLATSGKSGSAVRAQRQDEGNDEENDDDDQTDDDLGMVSKGKYAHHQPQSQPSSTVNGWYDAAPPKLVNAPPRAESLIKTVGAAATYGTKWPEVKKETAITQSLLSQAPDRKELVESPPTKSLQLPDMPALRDVHDQETGGKGSKAAEYLRKRRAEREKREAESQRSTKNKLMDSIPTFMF